MRRRRQSGVTLIEMLVVVAILGIVASIAYPSVASGLDSLRLSAAADDVATLFTVAGNHARRKQEWVEIRIQPHRLEALGTGLTRTVDFKDITASPEQSIFIDPLGTLPGAIVDLRGPRGAPRRVRIDPISGSAEVGEVPSDAEAKR